jgi:hypothetical protein
MKRTLFVIILVTLFSTLGIHADEYTTLWKQVSETQNKDLPQSEIAALKIIIDKAGAEHRYGQLLKAELLNASVITKLSPDSLQSAVNTLKTRLKSIGDNDYAAAAVYNCALGVLYRDNSALGDDNDKVSRDYFKAAMTRPQALAAYKAPDLEPAIIKGVDSKLFDNDLLSVICYETMDFATLNKFYRISGNRYGEMLSALEILKANRGSRKCQANKSPYLSSLDSLIEEFGDLPICGEVALEHYRFMDDCKNATDGDRIKYIRYALSKWGSYPPMNELRNEERSLINPSFSADIAEQTIIPQKPQSVKLNKLRHISSLTMKVYSVALNGDTKLDPENDKDYDVIKKSAELMKDFTQTRKYVGHPQYQQFNDSMIIGGLPVGVYMIEIYTTPKTNVERSLYFVSDVRSIYEKLSKNTMKIAVVNATTGQPLANATVRLNSERADGDERTKRETVTLTCNAKGEVTYKYKTEPENIYTYIPTDKACPEYNCWTRRFIYYNYQKDKEDAQIYIDRTIYRPGQTVYASAIVFRRKDLTAQAVEGKTVTMKLYDANNKEIETKDVVTNKMGTCATDFTLPSNGLTGHFHISANDNSQYFRVEEYKRPTFEITFPEVNKKYQSGDTLIIQGHARSFAGVPVQGAKVKYSVTRRVAFWWYSDDYNKTGYVGGAPLANDTVLTDGEGAFKVEIPLILPEGEIHPMFYNFIVSADVTDVAGETHNGEMSVPLGTRPTAFSCTLAEKILKDSINTFTFHLRNASGHDIDTELKYSIDGGNTVSTNTRKDVVLGQLVSGRHHLSAICENDTINKDFIVFSLKDTKPCIETKDWFYQSAKEFVRDNKQPVTIQIGSSDKDVHIFYDIISGEKVIESGTIDQSDALFNRDFFYKDEYGTGLLINYAWMKDGVFHRYSAEIHRPLPDKRLMLKWTTFRDRLTPGQKEEWKLNITRPDGLPVEAQLMATLFDKSLDEIEKAKWSFNLGFWQGFPSASWASPTFDELNLTGSASLTLLKVKSLSFSHFDEDMFDLYSSHTFTRGRIPSSMNFTAPVIKRDMEMSAAPRMMAKSMSVRGNDESNGSDFADLAAAGSGGTNNGTIQKESSQSTSTQVRENLNETAFFYPQLMSDSKGDVSIKFTLPESLTTWRFMGLAHTTDMNYGMIEGETVAKKDVMVQPDMPRFVRVGDQTTIVARIFNTSDNIQSGTARMELIDPETEKIVLTGEKKFSVNANETQTVTFDYTPDDKYPLLICKIYANGKTFSDGEQHYLPVLPNKERVTVTVPFTQNNSGTKSIDLQKLFPQQTADAQQSKLTVEYTNNPAWLMIQALPSMSIVESDNVISLCQAYYSSVIGKSIINSSPKIKTIVDSWKAEKGSDNSFISNLQKNQELKDIVLSETPWVADADNETSQKQALISYFDENTLDSRTNNAVSKMKELQRPDGSWSWFKEMNGSMYMTTTVAEMLVRLNKMCGHQENAEDMLDGAFRFMGKDVVKMVKQMKEEEKKGIPQSFPAFNSLHYLYLCALDGRKLPSDVTDANEYLISLMTKEIKNQSIYEKALSSIILHKNGNSAKAKEYAQSLKEYSVMTEEMGRYYDTRRANYSWCDYKIPTEVAVIEALKSITPDDQTTINEMLRWLLQEKRTQAWDTPINSVNAVYAFLNGNISVLSGQDYSVLAIDGNILDTQTATAGIGYVKTAIQPTSKMKTLTAKKISTGTSWGAVYAQFMQKTSDISQSNSGITLKREMIQKGDYHVGDKVKVRLTITSDRDYDFVQVIDKRAACMEPVNQLSGYHWGYYCTPKDCSTNYYFDNISKGTHVIETEYYIDRSGRYETGTCTAQCAYSPEYRATAKSETIVVK